jgi:hypothetical protein
MLDKNGRENKNTYFVLNNFLSKVEKYCKAAPNEDEQVMLETCIGP